MLDPFAPARVFCVGAAGSGVRAMAELLHGFGWEVRGTDRAKPDVLARMRAKGLAVTHDPQGRSWAERGDPRPDLLLHSPAVPPTDPARARAAAEGVPQATHVDLLAEMTHRRETIAVAGTHGKSGTAAILVHLLRASGRRVAGFVGAEPVDPTYSFAHPDPELLVVEACEWNRHFLRLSPDDVVLTGIETDHPDTFQSIEEATECFLEFCRDVPGTFTFNEDSRGADIVAGRAVSHRSSLRRRRDGLPEPFPFDLNWLYESSALSGELTLELRRTLGAGRAYRRSVPLPPEQHPQNTGLAIVHLAEREWSGNWDWVFDPVCAAMPSAPALRRRFEIVGTWRNRVVVDDYAHHPTALSELAVKASPLAKPGRTALVFQPHQLARTEALFDGFVAALEAWPVAAVLPVFPARETASDGECAEMARRLAAASGAAFLPDLDALVGWADDSTRPGDALVLAGAGDVDRARHLLFPGS